jgi:hypothetical protein
LFSAGFREQGARRAAFVAFVRRGRGARGLCLPLKQNSLFLWGAAPSVPFHVHKQNLAIRSLSSLHTQASRGKHGTVEVPFTLTSNAAPTHHSRYTSEGWDREHTDTSDLAYPAPATGHGKRPATPRAPCNRLEETPLERRPDGATGWSHLVVGLVALLSHTITTQWYQG